MSKLYTNPVTLLTALLVISFLGFYVVTKASRLDDPLLPVHKSTYPWKTFNSSDAQDGGSSIITINDDTYSLDFDYNLASNVQFSYASLGVTFGDYKHPDNHIDWSKYATVTLSVRCAPRNVLAFALHTFDEKVTDSRQFSTYRVSTTFFTCSEEWSNVEIDLKRLDTPEWWLQRYGLDFSNQDYQLDKIRSFSIVNSPQSRLDTLSNVKIGEVVLHGRSRVFIYLSAALAITVWLTFIYGVFRRHIHKKILAVQEKMQQNRPLIAYQQLPVESRENQDQNAVLRFMATEYANPDLTLQMAATSLGVNRTKINELLRDGVGVTFSTYLNKLRLTEAARLLLERSGSIAEIAYSVGYNNVSYFNRIFKSQYGCTPKAYQKQAVEEKHS
ncbi:helix-turn-helix domain-containing protein [Teredinibacter haidensis]|uniref:helix-turn-helix domain-containing protein n=1 Tax=Teredinibacter haidensis TaxID=2731755 RepID=UPI000948F595|nr:AraC family transcriptional regulator [Teredinibacter haidensis]